MYIETHISMGRAALGVEITVPTVDGDVKYTIPAGTQSGTMFRLKGKGVPKVHSSARGDQYVKVIVDTPKNLTSKQKEALEIRLEESKNMHEEINSLNAQISDLRSEEK